MDDYLGSADGRGEMPRLFAVKNWIEAIQGYWLKVVASDPDRSSLPSIQDSSARGVSSEEGLRFISKERWLWLEQGLRSYE
jgi:hypothetical protein